MKGRRIWEIGGFVSGAILVAFGAVALYMGINGTTTVRDELKKEYIVGSSDMTPSAIKEEASKANLPASIEFPSCTVADQTINTGTKARCFAQYMRIHALEATGGLTYAQMGRYQAKASPADAKGTNDEAAAATDANGQPISNPQRNIWINETALATALNVSYMAQQISIFGVVVGIALLLTGIGLIILAFSVFGREPARATASATRTSPQTATG